MNKERKSSDSVDTNKWHLCFLQVHFSTGFTLNLEHIGRCWNEEQIETDLIILQMMISLEQLSRTKYAPKDSHPIFVERTTKLDLSQAMIQNLQHLYSACNNTFVCLGVQDSHKKVLHLNENGSIAGQLILKQSQCQLFMMSDKFVTVVEYNKTKPIANIIQWNLSNHEFVTVNYRREIMPLIKVFTFSESQTFCICQYDHHTQTLPNSKTTQNYHTKYKLSYYKFPIKKQIIKPQMVFKTHTNTKEYGFHQSILKLNDHSMIGSISTKMGENDETVLKTFDFRNNPMGLQINYRFHVNLNYRKDLFHLWITDMWQFCPQNLYLKCELRLNKSKQEMIKQNMVTSTCFRDLELCEQSIHLTWAYKKQNTIRISKLKTPHLSQVQFLQGFNQKERIPSSSHSDKPVITDLSTNLVIRSLQTIPVYYISNSNEEVMAVDWAHSQWHTTYLAYSPTTVMYYRNVNASKKQKKEEKIEIVFQRVWNSFNLSEFAAFYLTKAVGDDICYDLVKQTASFLEGGLGIKPDHGWSFIQMQKPGREKF